MNHARQKNAPHHQREGNVKNDRPRNGLYLPVLSQAGRTSAPKHQNRTHNQGRHCRNTSMDRQDVESMTMRERVRVQVIAGSIIAAALWIGWMTGLVTYC